MEWKEKYNSITKQFKNETSRITPKEWNEIINILTIQANNNTDGILYAYKKIKEMNSNLDWDKIKEIIEVIIEEKIGEFEKVLFFENYFDLPNSGISNKLYVVLNEEKIYIWSEDKYIVLSEKDNDKFWVGPFSPSDPKYNFWIDTSPNTSPPLIFVAPMHINIPENEEKEELIFSDVYTEEIVNMYDENGNYIGGMKDESNDDIKER